MTSASPGSSRLNTTVDVLRTALAQSTDVFQFTLGGSVDEETAAAAQADGVPREFLDFCRVLDGVSCGPNMQLFGLEEAEEHQFYCGPVADSPLELSPEKLFCIGLLNDVPYSSTARTAAFLASWKSTWSGSTRSTSRRSRRDWRSSSWSDLPARSTCGLRRSTTSWWSTTTG